MNNQIAVICDGESYAIFKAIKASVFTCDEKNVENILKEVTNSFQIVYMADYLFEKCENIIKRYNQSVYPIIIPLPTSRGNLKVGIKNIVNKAKESLGIDVFKE